MPHVCHLAILGLPGGSEWLIILFVALLLFGARLPALMRSLGGSVREFKKGMDGEVDTEATKDKDGPPSTEGGTAKGGDPA